MRYLVEVELSDKVQLIVATDEIKEQIEKWYRSVSNSKLTCSDGAFAGITLHKEDIVSLNIFQLSKFKMQVEPFAAALLSRPSTGMAWALAVGAVISVVGLVTNTSLTFMASGLTLAIAMAMFIIGLLRWFRLYKVHGGLTMAITNRQSVVNSTLWYMGYSILLIAIAMKL